MVLSKRLGRTSVVVTQHRTAAWRCVVSLSSLRIVSHCMFWSSGFNADLSLLLGMNKSMEDLVKIFNAKYIKIAF